MAFKPVPNELMANQKSRSNNGGTPTKLSAGESLHIPPNAPIHIALQIPAPNKSKPDNKTKFYSQLLGMFPESYEERQQAVYEDLLQYLEYELDAIDKDEYVEAYPIATFSDHVIVYCWNTDKIYKALYTMEAGKVEFTELKRIQLNYEEMPLEAKRLANIVLPKREE